MALEHRYVTTNGIRLHCAVDGDGPLVVFLHGFPECWYSWRHQLAALAPRFRVVAPDLRGYNESDKPRDVRSYAMPELIADVRGLIDAFGEREAVIVGHDWGGGIAWNFAIEEPAATRRLVVMNCPHPAIFAEHLRTNGRQLARSWYMFFFQIPWLPETLSVSATRGLVGDAIRRSVVRQARLTDDESGVCATPRAGLVRCAPRSTTTVPPSAATTRCGHAVGRSSLLLRRPDVPAAAGAARGLAEDHGPDDARLGRAGRRALEGADLRDGSAVHVTAADRIRARLRTTSCSKRSRIS
jgi:pimeloyl-ACP methyl ester carboxylesterase